MTVTSKEIHQETQWEASHCGAGKEKVNRPWVTVWKQWSRDPKVMPEDHIPGERWGRKWKNMKPGKNSKEQSVGQDKMFRRGMRRLIDWFLLVTVIFMKLYYAKEAWGELFMGPLGVPTLREAGRHSNWSFWSRDSWKHIGFQLSSAFDAGWQPQVSSFCPGQVCSHHPHRERYLGSLGQSTLKWGPRVASEQVLYLHWTDGPLLWCHLCFSPQLGPLQLQFMKQTLHIGCIMPGVRNSLVSLQGGSWLKKCSCPPGT